MFRLFLVGSLVFMLLGCSAAPTSVSGWPPGSAPVADYDFNWRLSGDPTVAPLQVFSGAGRIWLQFAPGATPAALFAQSPEGMQPLPYKHQDPYIVVEGTWTNLVLRGGRYTAKVQHVTHASDASEPTVATPAVNTRNVDELGTPP